jgi:hypothetical protein
MAPLVLPRTGLGWALPEDRYAKRAALDLMLVEATGMEADPVRSTGAEDFPPG